MSKIVCCAEIIKNVHVMTTAEVTNASLYNDNLCAVWHQGFATMLGYTVCTVHIVTRIEVVL